MVLLLHHDHWPTDLLVLLLLGRPLDDMIPDSSARGLVGGVRVDGDYTAG